MRVFYFDDVNHPQFFWKQLVGGLFTVVATTGMDQDMMQRTLACKSVRDSQKNLIVSVCLQIVTIALFLFLGVYLYQFAALHGLEAKGDTLFPAVAWSGLLPASGLVATLFIVGLVMAGFPAGGSALTSLTTSFTIDILGGKDSKRSWIHTGMAVLMAVCILVFNALNSTSVIDAVYRLASYTYGPILGLFSFGLCSLFAATLCFESVYDVREAKNNVSIRFILEKYLSKRYSFDTINIISQMLDINEITRKDFIELEKEFELIGYE
jgi:uncharacterized sodium:solute symporter family permease YidK